MSDPAIFRGQRCGARQVIVCGDAYSRQLHVSIAGRSERLSQRICELPRLEYETLLEVYRGEGILVGTQSVSPLERKMKFRVDEARGIGEGALLVEFNIAECGESFAVHIKIMLDSRCNR